MPSSRIRPDGVRFEPETLRPQAQRVDTYAAPPVDTNAGKSLENAAKGFKELAEGTREYLKYQAAKDEVAINAEKALKAQQILSPLVQEWNDSKVDQMPFEEETDDGSKVPGIQRFDNAISNSGIAESVRGDPRLYAYVVNGISSLRGNIQNRMVSNFEKQKLNERIDLFGKSADTFLLENSGKDPNSEEVIQAAEGLFQAGKALGLPQEKVNELMMGFQHQQTKRDPTEQRSWALTGWLEKNNRHNVYATKGQWNEIVSDRNQRAGMGKVAAQDQLKEDMTRLVDDFSYTPDQMSDALKQYVNMDLITPAEKAHWLGLKEKAMEVERQVRAATGELIAGNTNFYNFEKKYQTPAIQRAMTIAGVKSADPLAWDDEDVKKVHKILSRVGGEWDPLKNILEKATPSDPENFDRAAALFNSMGATDATWVGRTVSTNNAVLYQAYNQAKRTSGKDAAVALLRSVQPAKWDNNSPEAKQARERVDVSVNSILKDGSFFGSKAMNSEYIRDRLTREALGATYIGINPDISVKEAAVRVKDSSKTIEFDVQTPKNIKGFLGNKAGFKPIISFDVSSIPKSDHELIAPAWKSYSADVLVPMLKKNGADISSENIIFMPSPLYIAGKEDVVFAYKMDATTGGQPVPLGAPVSLNTAILYHKQKGASADASNRTTAVEKIQSGKPKNKFEEQNFEMVAP